MKQPRPLHSILLLLIAVLAMHPLTAAAQPKKLKVFILAGQSNMEGHAKVETFDYIGDDPATAPLLKTDARRGRQAARVRQRVDFVSDRRRRQRTGEGTGKLTAGYGSRRQSRRRTAARSARSSPSASRWTRRSTEPVLIIKTAWGGKSLHTDFRPPSAGPYQLNDCQQKLYYGLQEHGSKDIDQGKADKSESTGRYYRLMIEHVKKVLADPKRVCPAYDPAQGYEIAGFVWLQGWNDMVDGDTYPGPTASPDRFAKYSEWLAHFIRDVRKDLGAPKMPFVIGVMGVGGAKAERGHRRLPRGHGGARAAAGVQRQRRRRADRAVLVGGTRSHRRQARARSRQMRYFLESQAQGPRRTRTAR